MNERLPLPERPVTKSREAFIAALTSLPELGALTNTELLDAHELAADLLTDIANFGEKVIAEQLRRQGDE
ncbi:hypothetical protein KRR55_06180 [Paeniglutamicibacter sp. ABSL32-1]|uniref:hypothetical protein n=1 Tax=Paeniglutamicibacter quisquiliarum TaxID=2849498 RepID=UPI001C2D0836|nr:hypothetical protein [Paeniglutamicibacter quisquiliarum]MBV1778700.1 hypothetical protein [Paeniglutamicibacter quisquiliarum]